MRPLAREEIVPLAAYGGVRDAFRSAVIAHKRDRRVAVGPSVTLVFEDRETLRFQVQEMLWVERIAEPERVQHELDVYNELMPGVRELSATLFVEITEPGRIRAELDRLVGIDEHVALVLGRGAGERALRARFDAKQMDEDRISAVQYIRFALDEAAVAAFAEPESHAALRISHPNYAHEAELQGAVRASLVAGLRSDPHSLVPPLPADAPPARARGPLLERRRAGGPPGGAAAARPSDRGVERAAHERGRDRPGALERALRSGAAHRLRRGAAPRRLPRRRRLRPGRSAALAHPSAAALSRTAA